MRAFADTSVLWNSQNSYIAQGKLEEAAPLYKRAVAVWEKALGPDHPLVATGLNNQAQLLRQMVSCCCGFVRAVEHMSVLRNSQTPPLRTQGKPEEALPLYTRSREIFEKVLGQDHPNVATLLNNEAELLRQMVSCCRFLRAVEDVEHTRVHCGTHKTPPPRRASWKKPWCCVSVVCRSS